MAHRKLRRKKSLITSATTSFRLTEFLFLFIFSSKLFLEKKDSLKKRWSAIHCFEPSAKFPHSFFLCAIDCSIRDHDDETASKLVTLWQQWRVCANPNWVFFFLLFLFLITRFGIFKCWYVRMYAGPVLRLPELITVWLRPILECPPATVFLLAITPKLFSCKKPFLLFYCVLTVELFSCGG